MESVRAAAGPRSLSTGTRQRSLDRPLWTLYSGELLLRLSRWSGRYSNVWEGVLDATLSLVLSVLALIVSATTAWLTLLRRATVRMTQPTTIYFGPDSSRHAAHPKVYLRTLLYATAKRGCILESMFVRLRRDGETQAFNVWVYGDDKLRRGSGLFIPDTGVTTNHHFLLPRVATDYTFLPSSYELEVLCSVVGDHSVRMLANFALSVTEPEATALHSTEHGLYFDWSPDETDYRSHIRRRDDEPGGSLFDLLA
jgi:hypothetical protein